MQDLEQIQLLQTSSHCRIYLQSLFTVYTEEKIKKVYLKTRFKIQSKFNYSKLLTTLVYLLSQVVTVTVFAVKYHRLEARTFAELPMELYLLLPFPKPDAGVPILMDNILLIQSIFFEKLPF